MNSLAYRSDLLQEDRSRSIVSKPMRPIKWAWQGPVEAYLDIAGIVALAKERAWTPSIPATVFSLKICLARACEKAGITFVGPPPNLLELLGDKNAARRLAASAGVPVLPELRILSSAGGSAENSARNWLSSS